MDIFSILTMVGGLAMFLFGMNVMGDGLVKVSGGRLEIILERLTSKRIMALITGAMVTAVIQSSSATTVMVVGFVNSGIMELGQAVGIIMGANVGTTITSWILSLTGIQGDNIFISLLKPTSFSPVLAAIGIVMNMTASDSPKNGKISNRKDIGNILLGFAVLMFGMDTMSGAVAPLADNEAFTGILTKFSNPILGMLAGAVLTAVIQSSSASVGILQALCATGAVGYNTAIPIIMGQNIGTCVTALISSVGASRNARRASMIHLYFNLIGTILFMIAFYAINSFVDFAFMHLPAGPAGIAIIHSCFNVGCAMVLFPFGNKLVKLATLSVPDRGESEDETKLPQKLLALDERFLDNPAFAINRCREAVDEMARIARDIFILSTEALQQSSGKTTGNGSAGEADGAADFNDKISRIIEGERLLDLYDDTLGAYLIRISSGNLSVADSRSMSVLLHSISDFERISDHARNIAETAVTLDGDNDKFTDECWHDIACYSRALRDIMTLTADSFVAADREAARQVEPMEEVVDSLCLLMKDRHVQRLRHGECSHESSIYFEDMVTDYERVADHCSNIAISLIEIESGEFDPHRYQKNAARLDPEWFQSQVDAYMDKYYFG